MNEIYLDNYRGFKGQYIPLRDVNFLVGENSSGKTSILVAIKLLTSPDFWLRTNISGAGLPFSTFSEFLSKSNAGKKHFDMGVDGLCGKYGSFCFVRFIQRNGAPSVSELAYSFANGVVSIDFQKSNYSYIKEKEFTSLKGFIDYCTSALLTGQAEHGSLEKESFEFPPGLKLNIVGPGLVQHFVNTNLSAQQQIEENEEENPFNYGACKWIAPIRAKPQSVYSGISSGYSAEGEHTPFVLNEIMNSKTKGNIKLKESINEFGGYSGLFDNLSINRYGSEVNDPFSIDVSLNGIKSQINNVGYGVSQVLPILVELSRDRSKNFISIQQPEVHLHPRAQASLGNYIFKAALDGRRFLIETHSDFIVDRFRIMQNKNTKKTNSQVLFVERSADGCKVYPMQIEESGAYPEEQPNGFREFFLKEELELIRI